MDDLKLLQRNGLIEHRCTEPGEFEVRREPLNKLESEMWRVCHAREAVSTKFKTTHIETDGGQYILSN
jgi:hypothetical protein